MKNRLFSSPKHPDFVWGPPSLLFMGNGPLALGAKQPGLVADHLPLLALRLKINEAISPLPHVRLRCTYVHMYLIFTTIIPITTEILFIVQYTFLS
jgi:hypothetical protein